MLKTIYISVLLFFAAHIQAQCIATDCPIVLPPSGIVSSNLSLSGTANPVMGQNNQYLRAVSLQIQHDAIDELDIELIAPNGSSLFLSTYQGIQIGQNITFDICFLACNETPQPDPGFPIIFESDAGYVQNGHYSGSYFPAEGCLNQLSGPVNGDWTLKIKDNFIQDGGKLNGWSLEFADNNGLDCTSGCLPPLCSLSSSQIGSLQDTFCTGQPALNLSISPTFPFSPPDPNLYAYTFIVIDKSTGVIIEYSDDPDLTSYPPGNYEIYGLLYEIADSTSIPDPNGTYSIRALHEEIQNNAFCAEPSSDHYSIHIQGTPVAANINFDPSVCSGDTTTYTISNYNAVYEYEFRVLNGAHKTIRSTDSSLSLIWTKGPGKLLIKTFNDCDTSQTIIIVDVIQTPDFNLSGLTSACTGDTVNYRISSLPDSSYSYSFIIEGGELVKYENDTIQIIWKANLNKNSVCVVLNGPQCSSTPNCLEVVVPDKRSLEIVSGSDTICQLSEGSSYVNTDIEVLSYQWSSTGLTFLSETDKDTVSYLVNGNADSARLCLTIQTRCGQFGPFCKNIQLSPLPRITDLTSNNTCGLNFELDVDIERADSLAWKQLSGPSPALIDRVSSENSPVTVTAFGKYEFVIEAYTELCMSSDTIVMNALTSPVTSNLNYECSLHAYSVSFDILNGKAPYSINGQEITGNTFSSEFIPSGDNYEFEVTDKYGCNTQVSGKKDCPCASYAGTMDTATLHLCAEISPEAIMSSNPDFIKDHNDTLIYIMYIDPSNPWGSLIASSMDSKFLFQMGKMQYGETYFISRVVGNHIDGAIDSTDPCLSVSNGQTVIFYEKPEINIDPVLLSCDQSFDLHASLSEDVRFLNWSLLSGPSAADIERPDLSGTAVSVTATGLYMFQLEAKNRACSQFDSVEVDILNKPHITLLDKNCQSPGTYILTVNIQGQGDSFNFNIPGRMNGDQFISDPLPQDTSFILSATDDNGCSSSIPIEAVDCSCKTEAGYTQFSEFVLCMEEGLDPAILNIQNTYLEEEDTLEYILHTGSPDSLGQIIQRSWGIPLYFDRNNMQSGQVYFLTILAGDYEGNLVDLKDPCLDMIKGIEVKWKPQATINLNQTITTCIGDTASVPIISTGPYPLSFSLISNQGRVRSVTLENNRQLIDISVIFDRETWNADTVYNSCSVAVQGSITLNGASPDEVEFKSKTEICNDITDPALLDLDRLFLKNPSIEGDWSSEELIINGSVIKVDGLDSGFYTVYFKTGKETDVCPPQMFTLQLYIKDCKCLPLTFPAKVQFCNTADKIDLQEYLGVHSNGSWIVENPDKNENPPVLEGTSLLVLLNATEGRYLIRFDAEEESRPDCKKNYTIELLVERQKSAGVQTSIPFYCIGQEIEVDLMTLLSNADAGGSWTYNNLQVNPTINIDSFPHGIQEFEYHTVPSDVCIVNKSMVRIEVNPKPEIDIKIEDVSCAGDQNGSIEIITNNDDYGPYIYILNDKTYYDNTINGLTSGHYKLLARNRNGCSSKLNRISISAPPPLELDLGEDLVVQKSERFTINAKLNIPESQVDQLRWTLSGEIIPNNNSLFLTHSLVNDGLIEATMINKDGCLVSDQVKITIKKDAEIYLPNVFNPNSQNPENRKFGISNYEHIREIKSFKIFDRWGNQLYSQSNFFPGSAAGYWDGTVAGQMMQEGVYIYSLIYVTVDGEERALQGDVTLLL